jgi:catechol 2,3-dioxygenase-like lactoylglutathione lyase family enzyme
MPVTLFDHLVYAVPNLQAANDALTAALGLRPVYGGEHAADYGTCNALLSLGPQCYLEVLAPVAATGAALPPFARGVAALPEGDVISFAVATSDLPAVQARALAAGLAVRPSKANSRVAPQGHTLRWQGLYLDHDLYRGLVPFYIDWMDSVHPSATAPAGAVVQDIVVVHPQPEGLRTIYAALDLDIPVHAGNRSAIVVTLAHGAQRYMLVGSGRGLGL